MALFIRAQIPTLISSSHADLKSCTPTCPWHPPKIKTEILKNILARHAKRTTEEELGILYRRLRFSSDADIVRLTNARIIIIICGDLGGQEGMVPPKREVEGTKLLISSPNILYDVNALIEQFVSRNDTRVSMFGKWLLKCVWYYAVIKRFNF